MVLSDDAKRFAIAREVYRGQTRTNITNGLILPTFIAVGYLVSRFLNKKLLLFKKLPLFLTATLNRNSHRKEIVKFQSRHVLTTLIL